MIFIIFIKIPYMLFVVLGLESAVTGSALGVQTTFSRSTPPSILIILIVSCSDEHSRL